jgi:hypothetical protein
MIKVTSQRMSLIQDFVMRTENHCRGSKGRMHCVVYSIQDGGTMSAVDPGLLPAGDYGTGQIFQR